MSQGSIIQQGRFTSDGGQKTLSIRSDLDWMYVYNYTNASAQGDDSVQFYWQRGMAAGTGLRYFKDGASNNLNMLNMGSDGFTLIDTSSNPLGNAVAVSGVSNATQPLVTTGNTGTMGVGSIVRLSQVSELPNLMGIDFEIGAITPNTNFTVAYVLANVPGAVGTTGFYRHVKYDPLYYPRRRYIVNVTQAAQAVVTFSVTHGYTVGQELRFHVDPSNDMIELDGLKGTVLAINTTNNTVTVDIDSSAFTAFAFQIPADSPFSPAHAVPIGMDTAEALDASVDILSDATRNTALIGVVLGAGGDAPGGGNNDVMYWVCGKSYNVNNE